MTRKPRLSDFSNGALLYKHYNYIFADLYNVYEISKIILRKDIKCVIIKLFTIIKRKIKEGVIVMSDNISYKKLWKLLIDNNIKTCAELSQKAEIAPSTISKMRHDKYVSMEVLVKLCRYFNCTFDDIVEIEKN